MPTSKEDDEAEVMLEGTSATAAPATALADGEEAGNQANGVAGGSSSDLTSDDDADYDDDDDAMNETSDDEEDKPLLCASHDLLDNFPLQRREDRRALLTHETMCALRQNIDSMNEMRDPSQASRSIDGRGVLDPLHAISAMDHNLWVLASAAALRLNETSERCKMIIARNSTTSRIKRKMNEMLPNALKSLCGYPPNLKLRTKNNDKDMKKRATASEYDAEDDLAAAEAELAGYSGALSDSPRLRHNEAKIVVAAVRKAKPRPKRKPMPKAKPTLPKSAVSSPSAVAAAAAAAAASVSRVSTPTANGTTHAETPQETLPMEEESVANTRKRKQARPREDKEEIKVVTKGKTPSKRPVAKATAAKKSKDTMTYCLCNRVSFGEMVGCDNTSCEIEWFHFECINLKSKPKGKWYCPDCRIEPNNSKLPKKPLPMKASDTAVTK